MSVKQTERRTVTNLVVKQIERRTTTAPAPAGALVIYASHFGPAVYAVEHADGLFYPCTPLRSGEREALNNVLSAVCYARAYGNAPDPKWKWTLTDSGSLYAGS